ncbi:hypothetical protein GCM10010387_56780 [Streptomyces inusitatus]|uniref:Lipoprotein n=1 Tax=Streptomyces inusitatus TaxID=68221 RepID=A0A918V1P3_9ACTN|nr:hypothetical protein [Streptomyces inusitatus]GGZ55316.1 hypothetical protein GCM10010387_56780 [Streptomyces inusitatus]
MRPVKIPPRVPVKVLLLMTVWAVSWPALSGCVTVEARPRPSAAADGPPPVARPQIARQGPAREMLHAPPGKPAARPAPDRAEALPVRPAVPPVSEPRAVAPPAAEPRARQRAAPPAASAPAPVPVRRTPRPAPSTRSVARPDVCALTEAYGGWRPGGAESRMCREAYGRSAGGAGRRGR